VCGVNIVAVNEVSAEDATTEPKHLLNPLVILDFKSQIYICLCLVFDGGLWVYHNYPAKRR